MLLIVLLLAHPVAAQDDAPFTRLFDTVAALSASPNGDPLAGQNNWRQVPEDNITHSFSGDAVLLNDKLAVFLKKQGGIEVYSKMSSPPKLRASLGHAGTLTSPLSSLAGVKILQNTSSGVTLEANFNNSKNGEPATSLRFRLTTGEAILEIQSPDGSGFVATRSPARYVVVPDYFGDDLVYTAESSPGLFLPAENFYLSLLEGGEAMLMTIWQSPVQDAWLEAPARGDAARLTGSRVRCLKGKSVWLAFLEAPGIWDNQSSFTPDDWKSPFPAKWRSSFVRENEVADSWDVEPGPGPEVRNGAHSGPLLTYPIDRSAATPLTATCPTDIMRNTLGVGPCQYILACEGLGAQGDPTPNSVMGWVEKQFEQKRDKKAADDIKERLDLMARHVADAQARIERYAEFAAQLRKLLGISSSTNKPAPFLSLAEDLVRVVAATRLPAVSPDHVQQLAAKTAALIGQTNALPACRQLGKELRTIGAVQDHALAKCRMDVRRARQLARTLDLNPSADTALIHEIQRLAEQTLQNK